MQLREYLKINKLRMDEFGQRLGTTGPTVCRIAKGQVPRKSMMVKIFEATGGLVAPNDIVGVRCVRPCEHLLGLQEHGKASPDEKVCEEKSCSAVL